MMMSGDNYLELPLFIIVIVNCFPIIFYKKPQAEAGGTKYKVLKISETNGNNTSTYVRPAYLSAHIHTTKTHNSFFHYSLVLIAIELKLSGLNLYVTVTTYGFCCTYYITNREQIK